jgi:hypothetical protein
MIFLNCTKNTELTTHPFARTFVLALRGKKLIHSAETLTETVTGARQNAGFIRNVLTITIHHRKRRTGYS